MQTSANDSDSSAELTWAAINNIAQNYGMPALTYDGFAQRWETDPIFKELVDRFDGTGVVLKTTHKVPAITQKSKGDSAVSKMAKHALKR